MRQYHDLLKHILQNGSEHEDRTGVGTISAFGYQMRFDLRDGFPIVTTKKVPFRWVAEELFWFLSGSTDEADLRARGVRIEEYTAPDPVTTDGVADMGHSWAAWFIDPSGNVLAIVQPKG